MIYDGILLGLGMLGCALVWQRPSWGFWTFATAVFTFATFAVNTTIVNEQRASELAAATASGRHVIYVIQAVPPHFNWLWLVWLYMHWAIIFAGAAAVIVIYRKLDSPSRYGGLI